MNKKTLLKWFTLIELMIVIIIIWILAVVLTESYITISKTALKIEQEKNLSEESLILTQVFQAISDEATIDYDKYDHSLKNSKWFTWTLYLTWWQWSWTSIYTTWEHCLELEWNFPKNQDGTYDNVTQKIQDALTWCNLVLKQWEKWEEIPLIANWKAITSNVMFRIIPYDGDDYYFENGSAGEIVKDLHQPAFWMFIRLYAPLYQPAWINKIDQPLQLFFNLNL